MMLFVWGGFVGGLIGCATRAVQPPPAAQENGMQQPSSQPTQESTAPVSLEIFSAFLDRG